MNSTLEYVTDSVDRGLFVQSIVERYKVSEFESTHPDLSLAVDNLDGGLHYEAEQVSGFVETIGGHLLQKVIVIADRVYFNTKNNLLLTVPGPQFVRQIKLKRYGDNYSEGIVDLATIDQRLQHVVNMTRSERGVFVATANLLMEVYEGSSGFTVNVLHHETNTILHSAITRKYQVIVTNSAIMFKGDNSTQIIPGDGHLSDMTPVDDWSNLIGKVKQVVALTNHVVFLDNSGVVHVAGNTKLFSQDVVTTGLRRLDYYALSIDAHDKSHHVQIETMKNFYILGKNNFKDTLARSTQIYQIPKEKGFTMLIKINTSNDVNPLFANSLAVARIKNPIEKAWQVEEEIESLLEIEREWTKAMQRVVEISSTPLHTLSETETAEAIIDLEAYEKLFDFKIVFI